MRSLMCCQAEEEGGMEKKKPNITNISVPFFFFFINRYLMKDHCIHLFFLAGAVQRQWSWSSIMNRYLFGDVISPSQTPVVWKITANSSPIFRLWAVTFLPRWYWCSCPLICSFGGNYRWCHLSECRREHLSERAADLHRCPLE